MTSAVLPTQDGYLLVLALVLPALGVPLALALGGRWPCRILLALLPAGVGTAVAVAAALLRSGDALVYVLGGVAPPLGIALRADGFSAAMLLTTAVVVGGSALFARAEFAGEPGAPESRTQLLFWIQLLATWAALNLVFVAADLFNLFVALELLTFGAVPLVCVDGSAATLRAALRYLLFALIGSVLYLLGCALLYGAYGTLDIALLAAQAHPDAATLAAGALMTAGLLAKIALFPLHIWLPPAHAGAPAAASAVLSALVVKGSFFILVRLWLDALPALRTQTLGHVLAGLGAAAILVGSVAALRQVRLKLLVAYSTVAQLGYLFLMFPLVGPTPLGSSAWTGGVLQAVSHAVAKTAMFLAAGLIAKALGHDRIEAFGGIGRVLPITLFAFGVSGLSLMGLPPSGGFAAKWLLLRAAIDGGQWWWALVIVAGGLFTGGYVYRVLAPALATSGAPPVASAPISRPRELLVLALALLSVAIGLLPFGSFGLLQIGRTP